MKKYLIIIILIALAGLAIFFYLPKDKKEAITENSNLPETRENINFNDWDWKMATENAAWSKRDAQTVEFFEGKLWLIGGVGGTAPDYSQNKNEVWVSEDGKEWELIIDNPPFGKIRAHESVVFQDKIWILGGVDGSE